MATCLISGDRAFQVSGKSGKNKTTIMPTPTVITPSMM